MLNLTISHRAIHIRMSPYQLNGRRAARFFVNPSDFCSPHRLGAVGSDLQANGRNPIADNPRVLAGGFGTNLRDGAMKD